MIPHITPGQKSLPAKDYNQLVDAANSTFRNQTTRSTIESNDEGRTLGTILVKNTTGDDLERGAAVAIGDSLLNRTYYLEQWKNTSLFNGDALTNADHGRFAILAEPIKDGEVGEAYIALECYAKIWIPAGATLATHGYADVLNVSTSGNYITASFAGVAQILWFDETKSDELGDAKIRFCPMLTGIPSASVNLTEIKAFASSTTIDEIGNAIADEYGFLYTSETFESYVLGWKTTGSSNPYSNGLLECIRDGFYRVEFYYNFAVRFHLATETITYSETRTTSTTSSHTHTYDVPRAYWFGNHTMFVAGINERLDNTNFHMVSPRGQPPLGGGGTQGDSFDIGIYFDPDTNSNYTFYHGVISFDSQFSEGDKLTPFFHASANIKLTGELAALLRLAQSGETEPEGVTTFIRVTRLRDIEVAE